jgi:hypothetical protein
MHLDARAKRVKLPVAVRITALQHKIALEREATQSLVAGALPRVSRIAHLIDRFRNVPRVAARYAPYLLPVAGMVFRKNRALRLVLRAWGAVRLAQTVAKAVRIGQQRGAVYTATVHK